MADNSPNLIPIGKYFSARPDGPNDRVITSITAGGKVALPGIGLDVTPNMRLVIVGRNLQGYNRAIVTANTNQVFTVFPRTSREGAFTFVAFDVPDYGDEKFGFRLRLESSSPDVASVNIDKNFNYEQETEAQKKDREDKAAAAEEAQKKAEAAQAGEKSDGSYGGKGQKEAYEQKQSEGSRLVGDLAAGAAGAAIGLAGAAVNEASAMSPVVHKWEGGRTANGSSNIDQGGASNLKPTDFANPVSDITGQAPVVRRRPPNQPGVATSAGSGSTATPQGRPAQAGVTAGRDQNPRAENQTRPETESQGRPLSPQPSRFSTSAAASSPIQTSGSPVNVGSQAQSPQLPNQNLRAAVTPIVPPNVSSPRSPSTSAASSVGTATQTTGETNIQSSAEVSNSATVSSTASVNTETKGSVSGKVSGSSNIGVKENISANRQTNVKAQFGGGGGMVTGGSFAAETEQPVPGPKPAEQPAPAEVPGKTAPEKPSPSEPFKNRPTLKLEKEYDAKFAAMQAKLKENAFNLDVKLKKPAGVVLPEALKEKTGEIGGNSAPRTSEDLEEGESAASDAAADGAVTPKTEQEENIQLPQKLPADLSTAGAPSQFGAAAAEPEPTDMGTGQNSSAAPPGTEIPEAPPEPSENLTPAPAKKTKVSNVGNEVAEKEINATLLNTAIGVWVAVLPTFGFSVLLGALGGDILWAFFKKIKLSTAVKINIAAMNAAVVIFVGIVIVFLLTLTSALCNNWITGGVIYLAGYSNVCTAVKNIGTAQTNGTPLAGGSLNTNPGSGKCTPVPSGPASIANLSQGCFTGNAQQASSIAGAESGGDPTRMSVSDKCADGNSVSVGLFQINLTNHPINGLNCSDAFSSQFTGSNKTCIVINQALYQSCVTAAQNPAYNIAEACVISKNGASWTQWGANTKCGF